MAKQNTYTIEIQNSNNHTQCIDIEADRYKVGCSGHVDFIDMIEVDPVTIEPHEKLLANGALVRAMTVLTFPAGKWNKISLKSYTI